MPLNLYPSIPIRKRGTMKMMQKSLIFKQLGVMLIASAVLTSGEAFALPGGAKAVRINLRSAGASASFAAYAGSGALMTSDTSGHKATAFFDASGTTSISKPGWLKDVYVSIGGSPGSAAGACGGFTPVATSSSCNLVPSPYAPPPATGTSFSCDGPDSVYRVSEKGCLGSGLSAPVTPGSKDDSVAIKIQLNRDSSVLGETENLLVVIEYQASGLMGAPSNPAACVDASGEPKYSDKDCVDQAYGLFIRQLDTVSPPDTPARLQLVTPPQPGIVTATQAGGSVQTRQVIVPLSSIDSTKTVIQLSRIFGLGKDSAGTSYGATRDFSTRCSATDSPLCLGMIIHSITIYRI